jgi:hypothetical protein
VWYGRKEGRKEPKDDLGTGLFQKEVWVGACLVCSVITKIVENLLVFLVGL